MISSLRRINALLERSDRRSAGVLLALMVVGMTLETLCTGLVVPAIALMMQQDLGRNYPQLQPFLSALGNPSQGELIVMVMLGLVAIYAVKNLFLAFLTWRQTRFAFGVQARLSQRLFTLYLRQPYTFHLQRNSAQLIRNVLSEVSLFTDALVNSLNVATEALVLAGISCLLLAIEPFGALVAVLVLGGAAWVFYRGTRSRIAR